MAGKIVISIAAAILVIAGCGVQQQVPMRECRSKNSIADALAELRAPSQADIFIKGNGRCFAKFNIEGKEHKENFPVKLWLGLPGQMRLQGDIAFDPKGLVVGVNEQEFWVSSKIGEDGSSYYWGNWSRTGDFERLRINPRLVLEAFGLVEIGDERNWSLSAEDDLDVLTEEAGDGMVKKVYVDRCDYFIAKVEYINSSGKILAVTELSSYRRLGDDISLPSVVKITTYPDGVGDVFEIKLDSMRPTSFSEAQRQRIFARPGPRGFKNIYEIVDGQIIERK